MTDNKKLEFTSTEEAIIQECSDIRNLLLQKNRSYGNSALKPIKIFSNIKAEEAINVRIDDKLSRIARGSEYFNEDSELDLIGYLVLKRVVRKLKSKNEE